MSLIFLKIDDTVYFANGLVYSKNPKTQINSPIESTIASIKVTEGQEVKKGDTLVILKNAKVTSEYNIFNLEIEAAKNKIIILKKIVSKAQEEKELYLRQIQIKSDMFDVSKLSLKKEVLNWKEKNILAEKDYMLTKSKYKADSILYSKGVISRIEFERQQKVVLENKKKNSEIKFTYAKKKYEQENLFNEKLESRKKIEKQILDLDRDIDSYKLEMAKLEIDIKNSLFNLDYITEEKNKLIIRSPGDGTISFLFNTRQNRKLIEAGTPLVVISPAKEEFYAKINLGEENLLYIKKGQKVQLKFDAYNYYKYGGIQGSIRYVSPSKIDGDFYCIVDFDTRNSNIHLKADYIIRGDIIINSLRSYEYIFKKVFEKI
ncbi:HlyD family secretion protein [Aquimarina sp. RZ0]|uniref:HlyD family secretion protein n=1 Tax=Aquimarina sp. RZ0 TaxID=2607730 RepID=UPI00165F2068|nr:HlyD family efflux transporter periplasmic adaptor subunit [Aquimarina sp. RZ0]